MVQAYAKKVKLDTTKQAVKSLLRTPKGKTVTDAKFNKEFLKKDKELRKYYLKSKNATLKDSEAKTFVNKALKAAQATGKMKISKLAAKKMGININKQGELGTQSMKKLYKNMVNEDSASAAPSNEPSAQEIRQQKRHEKAIKSMHKSERANEIRKDRIGETKDSAESSSDSKQQSQTVPRSGGGSFSQQQPSSNTTDSPPQQRAAKDNGTETDNTIALLILPLYNLSPNVDGLGTIVDKLNKHIEQIIRNLSIFSIVTQEAIKKTLADLHFDGIPPITDKDDILTFGRKMNVNLVIIGSIKQAGTIIKINCNLVNTHDGRQLPLVSIKQDGTDLFMLERQIAWQITHVLRGQATESDTSLPSSDEAVDLPI